MNISPEQYHRFLTNQCSEEERLLFASYLEQHPEWLEQWLRAEDWEQFQADMHLHPAFSTRMRDRFMGFIDARKRKRRLLYRISAAATVSGIILCTLLWATRGSQHSAPIVAQPAVPKLPEAVWQEVINNADTTLKMLLPDHSKVTLLAHSQLRYKKILDSNKRDFYLQGVALFDVTKDKHKPFTVYAGGTATTALGTSFKVTARPGEKNVRVKLFEGKVIVRADSTAVYLFPGDELTMNAQGDYHKKVASVWDSPVVKKNAPNMGNALAFTNLPMADVLDQLKQRFGADIRYNTKEINTIYVSATFTEQDTLSDILNILCTLNGLQLQGSGTKFAISR